METTKQHLRPHPVRFLHWVFKIADRRKTMDVLLNVLQMQVLRHEEFEDGCDAACNGPYDGKWSKTMVGYGAEDHHFVLELTYNYGVKSYKLGNDYNSITICSKQAYHQAQLQGLAEQLAGTKDVCVNLPDGYAFILKDEDEPGCPITSFAINTSNLQASIAYWQGMLGFEVKQQSTADAWLTCGPGQPGTQLHLVALPTGTQLERGTSYGRVAFSCPGEQLQELEAAVRAAGFTVHTSYISLDTPGKATVQVVILQDPDGHEICFVGDEGFRQLSQQDPAAAKLLADAMEADKSEEWAEKERRRAEMRAAYGHAPVAHAAAH